VDPFKILGINESATPQQVDAAYREKAKKHHPDGGGDAWAFQQVQEAYEAILHGALRQGSVAQGRAPGVWLTQLWRESYFVRWDGQRWQMRACHYPLTMDWGNVDSGTADAIEKQLQTGAAQQVDWDAIAKRMGRTVKGGSSTASPIAAFVSAFQRGISGSGTGSGPVPSSSAGDLLPVGAAVGRACSCYGCGRGIANGEPRFRRTVYTGDSRGGWLSKHSFGTTYRNYHGVRTVCQECAQRIDARGCAPFLIVVVLIFLVPAAAAIVALIP
jgi:hypothetical protein